MYDILIKNGTIIDGTGENRYTADLGIKDGKILNIGKLDSSKANKIIDALGKIVSPGFIDHHSHSDLIFLIGTDARNMLEQGITTEIAGHCGVSISPNTSENANFADFETFVSEDKAKELEKACDTFPSFMDYVDKMQLGTNMGFYIGHGAVRTKVMGFDNRKPTDEEMEKMKDLLRKAMESGAIGMTTGLIYPPGIYATEEEIVELVKATAPYGGIYTSHMRSEGDRVIEAVQETIRIGELAKVPVVISHHKIAGKDNWGKSIETLNLVDEANARGMIVRLDQYPFPAGATNLLNAMPPEYANEGPSKFIEKLKNKDIRDDIKNKLAKPSKEFENLIYGAGFDGVMLCEIKGHPEFESKTVAEIAKELNKDPYDTMFDLLIDTDGDVGGIYFLMCEDDIERIMKHKYVMGGTDAAHVIPESVDKAGHPRYISTFTRIISHYIRDRKIMSLEDEIRKITYLPTELIGIKNKGLLKEGYDADIVVFDYDNLKATADFKNPVARNEGIDYVLVNGEIAVESGKFNGTKSGKLIRKM